MSIHTDSLKLLNFHLDRIDANLDMNNDAKIFKDGVRVLQMEDVRCRNVIFATALISMVLVVTTAVIAIVSLRSKQNIIDKYTSEENLPTCASVSSFPPASGSKKDPNIPVLVASSFLKSSVRGLHTRIHNTNS